MDFYEDDPLSLRKVLDLLTVANEYCLFVETASKHKPIEVFDYLLKISPLLYLKGALLPELTPGDDAYTERYVTEEQYETVYLELAGIFGPADAYTAHFFEEAFENESGRLSLAENFTDIYQDLKDVVILYQKRTNTAKENAVYLCRMLFRTHWGPRILESLPPLHRIMYPVDKQASRDPDWPE